MIKRVLSLLNPLCVIVGGGLPLDYYQRSDIARPKTKTGVVAEVNARGLAPLEM